MCFESNNVLWQGETLWTDPSISYIFHMEDPLIHPLFSLWQFTEKLPRNSVQLQMITLLEQSWMNILYSKTGHFQMAYDTLQAWASISVSKLYNFHLPYVVTFVNKLFFCFVPRITSSYKISCKNCLFVSWGRPQFSLFYHTSGPLWHLQYMKMHIEAFPQP